MAEGDNKLSPDPRELPLLTKRGICIYIRGIAHIAPILKVLFDLLGGKSKWSLYRGKLSSEKAREIMKEVASYIYFETVKQIWEYGEGNLRKNDARKVLDVVSSYYGDTYGIDNLPEKLREYGRVENPIEHVSSNVERIARGENADITEQLQISGYIVGGTIYLFDGIGQMFELSEEEMAGLIEEYFTQYVPGTLRYKWRR